MTGAAILLCRSRSVTARIAQRLVVLNRLVRWASWHLLAGMRVSARVRHQSQAVTVVSVPLICWP